MHFGQTHGDDGSRDSEQQQRRIHAGKQGDSTG